MENVSLDFADGDAYRARIGRTVNDADNVLFTFMSNNTNQIHFNAEYARQTGAMLLALRKPKSPPVSATARAAGGIVTAELRPNDVP